MEHDASLQATLVSIIIPVFNRRDLLVRALWSIFKQSYTNFEVLVVDDNSSEDIQEIISSFYDNRISYIRHEKNQGANAARNTGVAHAKGSYIAFLDSDDEWLSEKLEQQVKKILASDERVGVVYSGYWIMLNEKKYLGHIPQKKGDIFFDELQRDHISPTSCVLVKKECFDKVGIFDVQMPARQDYEMWLRIAREFYFDYVQNPLAIIYFDDDPRRISLSGIEKQIQAEEMLLQKYKSDIEKQSHRDQKNIYSAHYLILGRRCWYNGSAQKAREFFMKALRIKPACLQCWILFFISFFGNRWYYIASNATRIMRTYLNGRKSSV